MRKEPFYPLEENYQKIESLFGSNYFEKSFLDELTPEEVILANDKLAEIVYGEEFAYYMKNGYLRQITALRDRLAEKYDKDLSNKLSLDDYGLLLVRPETMGSVDLYTEFLDRIGLEVIYQKKIKIDFDQYLMLYYDGIMMGLSQNDELFDFPTRTFNYIDNPCQLMIVKAKIPLNVPVSTYLHSFKGKHGDYSKDTLRGEIAYNSLIPYTVDGVTLDHAANIPLDPIGAYRALVRGQVDSDGWHDKVSMPILFYSGQGVHIPNRREIEKDLGVLCSEEDIKILTKKIR